jgi:hypothetical protein
MIWYLPPATTEGSSAPIWILCVISTMSTEFPVSGSVVCGVWQMMQPSMLRRLPPWNASCVWHLLHVADRMTSRVFVTAPPAGTHVYTVSARLVPKSNSVRLRDP